MQRQRRTNAPRWDSAYDDVGFYPSRAERSATTTNVLFPPLLHNFSWHSFFAAAAATGGSVLRSLPRGGPREDQPSRSNFGSFACEGNALLVAAAAGGPEAPAAAAIRHALPPSKSNARGKANARNDTSTTVARTASATPVAREEEPAGESPPPNKWSFSLVIVLLMFIFCGCGTQLSANAVFNLAQVENAETNEANRFGGWMIMLAFGMCAEAFCLTIGLPQMYCRAASVNSSSSSAGGGREHRACSGAPPVERDATRNEAEFAEDAKLILRQNSEEAAALEAAAQKENPASFTSKEEENKSRPDDELPARPHQLAKFLISGFFDFLSAACTLTSFIAVLPAINQVCRCSRLAFNGAINRFCFSKTLSKSQLLGIGGSFFGLIILSVGVCCFPVTIPEELRPVALPRGEMENFKMDAPWKGILLALIGNFFGSVQHSLQADFYQKIPTTPATVVVGVEGVMGVFCTCGVLIPVLLLFGDSAGIVGGGGGCKRGGDFYQAQDQDKIFRPGQPDQENQEVPLTTCGPPYGYNADPAGFLRSGQHHVDTGAMLGATNAPQLPSTNTGPSFLTLQRKIFLDGFYQLQHSPSVQLSLFSYFVFNALVCSVGSVVGRQFESSGRAILECVRIVAVWSVEIPYLWCAYGYTQMYYTKLDVTNWNFWLEKVSFVFIAVSTLVYFGVITVFQDDGTAGADEENAADGREAEAESDENGSYGEEEVTRETNTMITEEDLGFREKGKLV